MLYRHLSTRCFSDEFGKQMRFIAGPRQVGKSTLVTEFLHSIQEESHYFNWDFRDVRTNYQKNTDWYVPSLLINNNKKPWVAFDEIHKYPQWKNILKEAYDKHKDRIQFIITGSARLDLFRRSGDSLAGRYFLFRLNPLMLSEITHERSPFSDDLFSGSAFIESRLGQPKESKSEMADLIEFSGFPDPFQKASQKFQKKWQRDYLDKILYEDLAKISQIQDIENVARLLLLLPPRVCVPLSVNSLRGDLLVSYSAVQHYLDVLELGYIIFFLLPYSTSISRSILKEKKCYFYDWTRTETLSARFENYVAVELSSLVNMWQDNGDFFELRYIRTKDGKESDFLILKDKKPWLLIEVKLSKQSIASHHYKHRDALGGIPVLQLIHDDGVAEKYDNAYQISASRFL